MEHSLQLRTRSDKHPSRDDGEDVAHRERSGEFVWREHNEREKGKRDTDHENTGTKDHSKESETLEECEVEESAHLLGEGLLWRLRRELCFEICGGDGIIADKTAERIH